MKATGIVRRIDDLGRVVFPKRDKKNYENLRRRPLSEHIDTVVSAGYCNR